jgi:HK97 family phage major capsid protein
MLTRKEIMSIQALREQLSHENRAAKALLEANGDRKWSKEDQAKFDAHMDAATALDGQIKAHQRMLDADAARQFDDASKQASKGSKSGEIDAMEAVALYLRHGNNVTAEQAIAIRNAMSTTTTTEGGHTVPTEVATMVADALKAFGGMRSVAQIITTDGGNPLNYPTSDGTSDVGEIVAENAAATTGDITFGVAAVNPYKYSSKKIALPWELIQDSAIDVVRFVTDRLATRLGRITNTHYTVGTGSSQPFGVMARAATGKTGTTGQTLTVIYDDLIDLIHSVNSAYRARGAQFMLKDLSVAIVRKLKDTTGRPIWDPMGSIGGAVQPTLCGYGYVVNDDVATMAANAKSIAFGDFSQFVIRDVAGSMIMRRFDDSAFALNGQVGFCGWMRTGSNLLDTAAVKVYVNSAT